MLLSAHLMPPPYHPGSVTLSIVIIYFQAGRWLPCQRISWPQFSPFHSERQFWPLSWNLRVNAIISPWEQCILHAIFHNTVNSALDKFSDWFSYKDLSLNTSKTNYMYMVSSERRRIEIPGIRINNTELRKKKPRQCNILGITIDEKLSWKPHIELRCRKLSGSIGFLRKVALSLRLLYEQLWLFHITISPIWYFNLGSRLQKKPWAPQGSATQIIKICT